MRVNVFGIMGHCLNEDGILDKELPVEGEVALVLVVMGGLVLEGLSVPNEEEIVLFRLVIHN